MSLKERIQADIKKAMPEKDQLKVSVLRMLMAAVFNKDLMPQLKGKADGTAVNKIVQEELKKE